MPPRGRPRFSVPARKDHDDGESSASDQERAVSVLSHSSEDNVVSRQSKPYPAHSGSHPTKGSTQVKKPGKKGGGGGGSSGGTKAGIPAHPLSPAMGGRPGGKAQLSASHSPHPSPSPPHPLQPSLRKPGTGSPAQALTPLPQPLKPKGGAGKQPPARGSERPLPDVTTATAGGARGRQGHGSSGHVTPVVNPASAGGTAPPIPPMLASRLPPPLKAKKSSSLSPAMKPQRASAVTGSPVAAMPPAMLPSPSMVTTVPSAAGVASATATATSMATVPARTLQRLPSGRGSLTPAMVSPSQTTRRAKSGGSAKASPRLLPTVSGISTAAAAAAAARRIGEGEGNRTSDDELDRRGGAGRVSDTSSLNNAGNRTPSGSSPRSDDRGGAGFNAHGAGGKGRHDGASTTGGSGGAASFSIIWQTFKESCGKQSWLSAFLAWSYHIVHILLAVLLLFSPMLMRSAVFSQVTMSRSLLQAQGLVKPSNDAQKPTSTLTTTTTQPPTIPVTIESIWSIHDAIFFSRPGETVVAAPISESFTKLHDNGGNGDSKRNKNGGTGTAANKEKPNGQGPASSVPVPAPVGTKKDEQQQQEGNDPDAAGGHAFVAKKTKKAGIAVYDLVSPIPIPAGGADRKGHNRKKAVSGRTTLGKIVEAWEASPLYSSPLALALYYYLYVVGSVLLLMIGTDGRLTGHCSLLRMAIGGGEILWFVHHGGHSFLIFLWCAALSRWPRRGLTPDERRFLDRGTPYATVNRATGEVQFRWYYRVADKASGMNGTPYTDGVLDMQRYLYDHAAILVPVAQVVAIGFLGLIVVCVLKDALRVLEAVMGVRPLCEPEGYVRCPLCGELIEPCDVGALASAAARRRRQSNRKRLKQRRGFLGRCADRVTLLFHRVFRHRSQRNSRDGYEAVSAPSSPKADGGGSGDALSAEARMPSSLYDTDVSFYEGGAPSMVLSLASLTSSSSSSGSSSTSASSSRSEGSGSSGSEEVESSEEDENEGGIVKVIVAPVGSPNSVGSGSRNRLSSATAEKQALVKTKQRGEKESTSDDRESKDGESHSPTSDRRHGQPHRHHHEKNHGEKLYLSHATRHVHHRCPKLYLDADNATDDDDEEGEDEENSDDASENSADAETTTTYDDDRASEGGQGSEQATDKEEADSLRGRKRRSGGGGNSSDASSASLNSDPSKGLKRKRKRHRRSKKHRGGSGRQGAGKAKARYLAAGGMDDDDKGSFDRNRSMSPRRRIPKNKDAAAVIPVFAQPTPATLMRPSSPDEGLDDEFLDGSRRGLRWAPATGTALPSKRVPSLLAVDSLAINYSFAGPVDGYGAVLDRPYSQRLYPDGTPIPVGGVGAMGEISESGPGGGGGGAGTGIGGTRLTVGDHYVSRAVYDPFKDGEDEFRPGNAFPSYERAGWYSRLTYNWLNPLVGFAVLEPTLLRNDRFLPSLPEYLTSLENTAIPVRWLWVNRRTWFSSMVTKPGAIIPTEEALDVAEEQVLQLADLHENTEEDDEDEDETESSEGQAMVVLGKKPLTHARFRAQRPRKEMEERVLLALTWPLRKLFSVFFYSFYIGSSHTIARTHKRLMRALLKDRLAAAAALGELGYGEQLETTYALAEMASSEDSTEHGSAGSVLPIHMRRQLALSDVSLFYIFLEHRSGRRFVYAAGALLLVQNVFMFSLVPLIEALIRNITPHVVTSEEASAVVAAAAAARQGSVGGSLTYGMARSAGGDGGSLTTSVDISAGLLNCLGIAVVLVIQNVAYQFYWSQVSEAAMEAKTAVRTLVLEKVMALPLAQRTFSDDEVVGLVQNEALRVSACLTTLHHTWSNPLCLLVAVAMLWAYTDWVPALVVLVEIIVLVPLMRRATAAIRQRQREAPSGFERQSILMEALMNMRAVKAMLEESTYVRLIRRMRGEEAAAKKTVSHAATRFVAVAEAGMLALVVSFFAATYWTSRAAYGGKHKAERADTVFDAAVIIPCMVVLTLMWNPITEFPALFHSVARGYLSMKRIEAFLRQSPDEFVGTWVDLTTAKEHSIGYGRGSVVCRGCSFTWQHDLTQEVPQPQLINVNMDILPGELVVIQGSVGAGKSTLLLAVLGEINRCVDLDDRSDAASPFLQANRSSSESFEVDSANELSAADELSFSDLPRPKYTETTALLATTQGPLSVTGAAHTAAARNTGAGTYGSLGSALTSLTGGGNRVPSSPNNSVSSAPGSGNARRVQTHRTLAHSPPQALASLKREEEAEARKRHAASAGGSGAGAPLRGEDEEQNSEHSTNVGLNSGRMRTEGFLVFGSIVYCSEEPWLQNDTIRANITVGGNPSQTRWYQHVIRACALEDDFRKLPLGDKTVIGEKGAALTTSQKVRIALARALFTKADIYLLDSILTWLDEKTRTHIINEVFHHLLRDKTVIMATNVCLSALRPHRIFTVQEEGLVREDTHLYKEVSDSDDDDDADSAEDSGYEAQREERRPVRGPNLTAVIASSNDDHSHHALPTLYAEEFEEPVVSDTEKDFEKADIDDESDDPVAGGAYVDEDDIAADELFEDAAAEDAEAQSSHSVSTTGSDSESDGSDRTSDSDEEVRGGSDDSSHDSDDAFSSTATSKRSARGDGPGERGNDERVSLAGGGDREENAGSHRHRRRRRHHRRRHHRKGAPPAKDKRKQRRQRKKRERERRRKARRAKRTQRTEPKDKSGDQELTSKHSSRRRCRGDAESTLNTANASRTSKAPSEHGADVTPQLSEARDARRDSRWQSEQTSTRMHSSERGQSAASSSTSATGTGISSARAKRYSGDADHHRHRQRDRRRSEGEGSFSTSRSSSSTPSASVTSRTSREEDADSKYERRSRLDRKRQRRATIKKSRIPETMQAVHIFVGFMGKQAWWLLLACLLQQLLRLGVDVWVGIWLVQPDWLPDALSNKTFLEILAAIAVLVVCVVPIRGFFFHKGIGETLSTVYQLAVEQVFRTVVTFFMEKNKTSTTVLRILTKDVEIAEHSLPESIDIILSASMQLAAVAVFNILLNPCFVLVLPMAVVLFCELTERYIVMIRELRRLENRSVSGTVALLKESLNGAPMVRCFALQDRIREEYCRTIDITNSAGMVAYMTERWVGLRLYFISILLIASVAVLGVLFASTWMAPGLTGIALVLCLRIGRIFTSLCRRTAHFHAEWSSVRRLLTLLLRVPTESLTLKGSATLRNFVQVRRPSGQQAELEDTDNAPLIHLVGPHQAASARMPKRGASGTGSLASKASSSSGFSGNPMVLPVLEMVNVTARYGRSQAAALNRMNLVVYPGERVGLVGKAGQGKTSVFNVLLRLVDVVESGRVFINGVDADRVPYPILRSWFAVIPQSPVLVSGTWRDNLLVGYHPTSRLFRQWHEDRRHHRVDSSVVAVPVTTHNTGEVAQIGDNEVTSDEDADDRVFVPRAAAAAAGLGSSTGYHPHDGTRGRSAFLSQASPSAASAGGRQRRRRRSSQRQNRSGEDRSVSAPQRRPHDLDDELQDQSLWRALRIVGLAYLCELDGGLDSPITGTGSGSASESLGLLASQRQLLCLARAVLHRPPFILLEDATSPVSGDSPSDLLIRQVLSEELRDSTVLVIVHRIRTVASLCTRVVAIKEGTITPITEPTSPPPSPTPAVAHTPASDRLASPSGSAAVPSGLPSLQALAAFIE